MLVRMIAGMVGLNFAHNPGKVLDVPEKQGRRMIAAGLAVATDEKPPTNSGNAVVTPPPPPTAKPDKLAVEPQADKPEPEAPTKPTTKPTSKKSDKPAAESKPSTKGKP